jgi:hypothetical protein
MNVQILTELPFVVLRLLKVEDAKNLFRLVNENREYLRKWLPWLDETESQSDQLKFIETCSASAATGTQFHYAILLHGEIGTGFIQQYREAQSMRNHRILARKVSNRARHNDGGRQGADRGRI